MVPLKQALDREGFRLPVRIDGTGETIGGGTISSGHLRNILTNPIYVGCLSHKGKVCDGQHPAIVDVETWHRAQAQLASHAQDRKGRSRTANALLAGKLFDDRGWRMSPVEASRGTRPWRYYVSQAILQGRKTEAGSVPRVPAAQIEEVVFTAIRRETGLSHPEVRPTTGADNSPTANDLPDRSDEQTDMASGISMIDKVTISSKGVSIKLRTQIDEGIGADTLAVPWTPEPPRRRREIIQGEGSPATALRPMRIEARRVFARTYLQSRRWLDRLMTDPSASTQSIANEHGRTERSIRHTLFLAFLDPLLVQAAIDGRLPRGLGLKRLVDLPPAWSEQWVRLGLVEPARRENLTDARRKEAGSDREQRSHPH